MINFINEVLNAKIESQKYILSSKFPLYLKHAYSYTETVIIGCRCLCVTPAEFSLASYKKQSRIISELSGLPVVLLMDSITPYQRKALIRDNIPFIIKDTQIFLPFLAVYLTEKYSKSAEPEKFSPVTQFVFLNIFYNQAKLTITELAEKTGYTPMSISRAYSSLVNCGLFDYHTEGRKKYLIPNYKTDEILDQAEKYMINPVSKKYCYMKQNEYAGLLKSGLSALSEKSMLAINDIDICYAADNHYPLISDYIVSPEDIDPGNTICLEKWCYDPKLLSTGDCVDDISLIMSLKNSEDERIQISLDELRSKYKW